MDCALKSYITNLLSVLLFLFIFRQNNQEPKRIMNMPPQKSGERKTFKREAVVCHQGMPSCRRVDGSVGVEVGVSSLSGEAV
jgi:hypothetical protein